MLIQSKDLARRPTLSVGQAADLKIDTGTMRVWLSRCGIADGEAQPVQVERLVGGRWVDVTAPENPEHSLNDIPLDGEFSGHEVRTITRRRA